MRDYRVYTLGEDGHFVDVRDLQCATDAEAVEKAKQFLDPRNLQVWCRGRYVAHIPSAVPRSESA
jgi:hypothetical protein